MLGDPVTEEPDHVGTGLSLPPTPPRVSSGWDPRPSLGTPLLCLSVVSVKRWRFETSELGTTDGIRSIQPLTHSVVTKRWLLRPSLTDHMFHQNFYNSFFKILRPIFWKETPRGLTQWSFLDSRIPIFESDFCQDPLNGESPVRVKVYYCRRVPSNTTVGRTRDGPSNWTGVGSIGPSPY